MLNRREFLGGLMLSGVAGCTIEPHSTEENPNSTLSLVSKTWTSKAPSASDYPLSKQQILSIPYATLGVRIDRNPRVVLVLASINDRALQWVSADFVSFYTRDGWLLKTQGLQRDLTATRWREASNQDPLRGFVQSGALPPRGIYREIDVDNAEEQGIAVESRFESRKDETITILGEPHLTRRIDEIANMRAWHWEVRNSFWLDPLSGDVRRSVQHYCPEMPPIELEVLKRAAV